MKRTLLIYRSLKIFLLLFGLFSFLVTPQKAFSNDGKTKISTAVNFYTGTVQQAKELANTEGKLFFIDFYAEWCMPCKWMDQTTFNDRQIATLLNENYVSIKVDIDDREGFDLKNKYDVQYLPTMIIFNSAGKVIDRIEETMPARKLLAILEGHNNPENRKENTKMINISPSKQSGQSNPAEAFYMSKEVMDTYQRENENRIFRLQMGVFDDHENAFNKVTQLRDEFMEPIIVLNDYKDNAVRYKVMMGEFSSLHEAEGFRKIVKRDFNYDCIVQ